MRREVRFWCISEVLRRSVWRPPTLMDPLRKSGGPKCCYAQHGLSNDAVKGVILDLRGAHETAQVHHVARWCTIKARMGATHFLMETLPRVASEMALHVLAYNLTRVMNIMGIQPLMAAMRA